MNVREAQRRASKALGYAPPADAVERVSVPMPAGNLHGMGPLTELWVRRKVMRGRGPLQKWFFDPCPRLFYDESAPKRRLFILGGGYRVVPSGIVRDGAVGLRRLPVDETRRKLPRTTAYYAETHGGRDPLEAVQGPWLLHDYLVIVGVAEKIAYRTDRNDAHRPKGCWSERCELTGTFNWRHDFGEYPRIFGGEQPLVACDPSGRNLVLVGGDYSVKDGWIVG